MEVLVPRAGALGYGSAALRARGSGAPQSVDEAPLEGVWKVRPAGPTVETPCGRLRGGLDESNSKRLSPGALFDAASRRCSPWCLYRDARRASLHWEGTIFQTPSQLARRGSLTSETRTDAGQRLVLGKDPARLEIRFTLCRQLEQYRRVPEGLGSQVANGLDVFFQAHRISL